jgi:hypothetical protein
MRSVIGGIPGGRGTPTSRAGDGITTARTATPAANSASNGAREKWLAMPK